MADKKISELTALTGALNTADALAIADDSASQTKKIKAHKIKKSATYLIANDVAVSQSFTGLYVKQLPGLLKSFFWKVFWLEIGILWTDLDGTW